MYEGTKHTCATHARRRGVPVDQIAQVLGHADLRSTDRHAKPAAQVENVLRPECTVSAIAERLEKPS
jgi:integrase